MLTSEGGGNNYIGYIYIYMRYMYFRRENMYVRHVLSVEA